MSDNENTQQGNQSAAAPQPLNSENTVPYMRFKEVNDKYRALEERLAQMEQENTAKREKELAEQQRWQELAEQRKAELDALATKAGRADELEQALQATVTTRVEQLPEAMRSLVPNFSDPRQTLEWLNANAALLMKPAAPGTDAGTVGDGAGQKPANLTQMQLEIAKAAGMTPEQYAAQMTEGQGDNKALSDALTALEKTGHLR